jgi:hypothetical protein
LNREGTLMSDARVTETPLAGEVPPRPDLPYAHAAQANPAEPGTEDREDEMEHNEEKAHPVAQPFEPIVTDDTTDGDAEPGPSPVAEPVSPRVSEQVPHGEPDSEPKRRWRRKHKQPQPPPAAEVPLEQGRAEPVPGPRGMFEKEAGDPGAPEDTPPRPETIDAPATISRPDTTPVTPFEREASPTPETEPKQDERRGPVIVPAPGHYRLPDDFAFGPGAKPSKAKRGT